ncbi:MAG TPA: glycosyltransferase [Fulvivirga sp.]|nr:glycosyltransferase [Fulvivirga sp.]
MHLLIIPSYYPNSYNPIEGIYFKVQAESQQKLGYNVGVVAPLVIKHYVLKRERKIDFGYKINNKGIPTFLYQFPSFPIFKKVNDLLRLYFGKKLFRKYVNNNGVPNLIHLHSFENGILARWIKREYNIPFVTTEHSSGFQRKLYTSWQLNLARKTYEESSTMITVSEALKSTLIKHFDIESTVVGNMIDVELFAPRTLSKKYDFITVGGFHDSKNYPLLIDAFTNVRPKNPSFRLAIIGNGPLMKEIEEKIIKNGLSDNIALLGSQTPNDIVKLLNQSLIFVSSSKIETFGVAIIEAMSCGLPVVVTKSGGPDHLITDDSIGLLSDHNAENLSKAINKVFENINSYDNNHIRQSIVENYSASAVCDQLKNIYKKII